MKKKYIDLKKVAQDAMRKYGFNPEFSRSVLRQVESVQKQPFTDPQVQRRDLQSVFWSSIDNADSLDLDQIEFCERVNGDIIHVLVAIADVDQYVQKNTPVDRHAAFNGTSVYTGVKTFPMLPDALSKGITSLLPGQSNPAFVIEYDVMPDGSLRYGKLYRAVVANKAKLVYEEVGDWLEGVGPAPEILTKNPGLEGQILLQYEASKRLRKRRMEQGALDLDTLESQVLADDGIVKDLILQRQNSARCIIEEFMVATNRTIAEYLTKAGLPMIHRVVRTPKYWDKIVHVAETYHVHLPKNPDSDALSRFLKEQRARDPERFSDLSLTIVKLMGAGEYVPFIPGSEPIGHFALAVTRYTHGTAPNRRYVDLIIQRLIKAAADRQPSPYSRRELTETAEWLTRKEISSKKVERFMRKSAAAVLLREKIGEVFEGFITGASPKGTYVRLLHFPAEGRIIHGEAGLRVGQKTMVRLIHIDPYQGFIDFERVSR